jgi:hypothetical protein
MNDIRAKFEEIWPVPECVEWSDRYKQYVCPEGPYSCCASEEYSIRLDTFTRCQETMAPVMSLMEELVEEIESCYSELRVRDPHDMIRRAKQIVEHKK